MPNTAITLGTKLFKGALALRRIGNKVSRLNRELSAARDAKDRMVAKVDSLKRRATANDHQIASAIWDSYFAD